MYTHLAEFLAEEICTGVFHGQCRLQFTFPRFYRRRQSNGESHQCLYCGLIVVQISAGIKLLKKSCCVKYLALLYNIYARKGFFSYTYAPLSRAGIAQSV